MRPFRLAPVVLFLFTLAAFPATAQDGSRFGLGVRLNDLVEANDGVFIEGDFGGSFVQIGGVSILFPIDAPGIRFEPELGFGRLSFGSGRAQRSLYQIRAGLGLFARRAVASDTHLLFGARGSFVTVGGDDIESDPLLGGGPFVGAEYGLGAHFSVGAESGVRYERVVGQDSSTLTTESSLYVRFFF